MIRIIILAGISLLSFHKLLASNQEPDSSKQHITFESSYIGDICTNHSGGIKKGTTILGMGNLGSELHLDKLINGRFFKGVTVYINGAVTHGQSFTENYVGDFQTVSNIDAGDHTYLQELWIKKSLSRFELTLGLQDFNSQFSSSNSGGEFINSSFGVPSVISDNSPVSIFPLTTLGASTVIKISDKINFLTAIFDGAPTDFDDNRYNTSWELTREDGIFYSAEIQFNTKHKTSPASYKVGYYYHSTLISPSDIASGESVIFHHNYGLYGVFDQTIWQNKVKVSSLSAFAQICFSPKKINNHNNYLGLGAVLKTKIFNKEDKLGLAVGNASFKKGLQNNETVIEFFYKSQITENTSIHPDFQYIINPAGTDQKLKNALVSILRVEINL